MSREQSPHRERLLHLLAQELEELIAPIAMGEFFSVPPSAAICASLERFIPAELSQQYPEWRAESLDGIFVARATKTGPKAAEFAGAGILISDQTLTPLLAELELTRRQDQEPVRLSRLKIGEVGGGPLGISGPVCNSKEAKDYLANLIDRLDAVTWSYRLDDGHAG